MAKKSFFFGTLAMVLALVFGLALAGCETDTKDEGEGNKDPSVTISGTPKVGEKLTASVSNISGEFRYMWRYATSNGAGTEGSFGENAPEVTLTASRKGDAIFVVILDAQDFTMAKSARVGPVTD